MLMNISHILNPSYNFRHFLKIHLPPDRTYCLRIRRLHADLQLNQPRAHPLQDLKLLFIQKIRRHLKMKIRNSIIMLQNIIPYRNRMIMPAIKRPVHKLHLRDPMIQEKLKLTLHQLQVPESELLIHRRQTVTAGKRTAPAGLIIDNLMLKILHMMIHKRNPAQIHHRTPGILYDPAILTAERNSCHLRQSIIHTGYRTIHTGYRIVSFLRVIDPAEAGKSLLALALHNSLHLRHAAQHIHRIIRHLRASEPDRHPRPELPHLPHQNFYIIQVPDITRKTQNIRTSPVNIHQNIIQLLINRILRNLHHRIIRISPQTINSQIRMNILRIHRYQQNLHTKFLQISSNIL